MAQDDLFSKLPMCTYGGIFIPVEKMSIFSGSAVAWHTYPYRAGADAEFTGREQTTGQIIAPYFMGVQAPDTAASAVLWPQTLGLVRAAAQGQVSQELVLPGWGHLPKAVIKIHEELDGMRRDGAHVTIQFWEDSTDQFTNNPSSLPGPDITSLGLTLDATLTTHQIPKPTDFGPHGVTSFAAAAAQVQRSIQTYQSDLARPISDINSTISAIKNLVNSVASLRQTKNWPVLGAANDLQLTITKTLAKIQGSTLDVKVYVTLVSMGITQVASVTENTTAQLLKLNSFSDANNIDAGTRVRFYVNK